MLLNELRNKHQGQTAFVLASGPSTRHADVERMHKAGIVITMSSSVMHDENPDYHLIIDAATSFLKSFDLVAQSDAIVARGPAVSLRDMIPRNRILDFQNQRSARLSREAEALSQWTTSPITAVHFAFVMGCKKVVLIGCDCQREEGKRYFYEFWNPPVDDPMVNSFITTGFVRPHRRIIGIDKPAEDSKGVEGGWFGAARSDWDASMKLLPDDAEVVNASGGRLECFPMVDIEMLLGKKSA